MCNILLRTLGFKQLCVMQVSAFSFSFIRDSNRLTSHMCLSGIGVLYFRSWYLVSLRCRYWCNPHDYHLYRRRFSLARNSVNSVSFSIRVRAQLSSAFDCSQNCARFRRRRHYLFHACSPQSNRVPLQRSRFDEMVRLDRSRGLERTFGRSQRGQFFSAVSALSRRRADSVLANREISD